MSGYRDLTALIRNEDIYPGACIVKFNGCFYPSKNSVKKLYGAAAVRKVIVIPRPEVRAFIAAHILNL